MEEEMENELIFVCLGDSLTAGIPWIFWLWLVER